MIRRIVLNQVDTVIAFVKVGHQGVFEKIDIGVRVEVVDLMAVSEISARQ